MRRRDLLKLAGGALTALGLGGLAAKAGKDAPPIGPRLGMADTPDGGFLVPQEYAKQLMAAARHGVEMSPELLADNSLGDMQWYTDAMMSAMARYEDAAFGATAAAPLQGG